MPTAATRPHAYFSSAASSNANKCAVDSFGIPIRVRKERINLWSSGEYWHYFDASNADRSQRQTAEFTHRQMNFQSSNSKYTSDGMFLNLQSTRRREAGKSQMIRSTEKGPAVVARRSSAQSAISETFEPLVRAFESLERATALLSEQNISEAIRVLRLGTSQFPEDRQISNLLRVVSPSRKARRVKVATTDRQADLSWIRSNGFKFSGEWVAVDDGHLLGSGTTLDDLLANLGKSGNAGALPLILHIASNDE